MAIAEVCTSKAETDATIFVPGRKPLSLQSVAATESDVQFAAGQVYRLPSRFHIVLHALSVEAFCEVVGVEGGRVTATVRKTYDASNATAPEQAISRRLKDLWGASDVEARGTERAFDGVPSVAGQRLRDGSPYR